MSSWTYRLVRYRDGRGYAAGDDGAHEEAGVDRPAQAHHGDLAARQGLVQPSLVLDNHVFVGHSGPPRHQTPRLMNAGSPRPTRVQF